MSFISSNKGYQRLRSEDDVIPLEYHGPDNDYSYSQLPPPIQVPHERPPFPYFIVVVTIIDFAMLGYAIWKNGGLEPWQIVNYNRRILTNAKEPAIRPFGYRSNRPWRQVGT
jgi:hypothetical protein